DIGPRNVRLPRHLHGPNLPLARPGEKAAFRWGEMRGMLGGLRSGGFSVERIPALAVVSALVVAGLLAGHTPIAAAATDPNVGFDISYPQCNGTFPSGGAFGIAGVNGGRLYSSNPCLGTGDGASEL